MTDEFWEVSLKPVEPIDETFSDTAGRVSCRTAGMHAKKVCYLMGLQNTSS